MSEIPQEYQEVFIELDQPDFVQDYDERDILGNWLDKRFGNNSSVDMPLQAGERLHVYDSVPDTEDAEPSLIFELDEEEPDTVVVRKASEPANAKIGYDTVGYLNTAEDRGVARMSADSQVLGFVALGPSVRSFDSVYTHRNPYAYGDWESEVGSAKVQTSENGGTVVQFKMPRRSEDIIGVTVRRVMAA